MVFTEWFDHDGTPLPEDLDGYTGRLAKITGVNSLVGGSAYYRIHRNFILAIKTLQLFLDLELTPDCRILIKSEIT